MLRRCLIATGCGLGVVSTQLFGGTRPAAAGKRPTRASKQAGGGGEGEGAAPPPPPPPMAVELDGAGSDLAGTLRGLQQQLQQVSGMQSQLQQQNSFLLQSVDAMKRQGANRGRQDYGDKRLNFLEELATEMENKPDKGGRSCWGEKRVVWAYLFIRGV